MRFLSALLFAISAATTLAQPAFCDSLNAGFSFTPSGGGYQFSNATTGTGMTTTWVWNFGDGTTSNNPQPFHEFPSAGVYEVCLMAISIYLDNGQPFTCVDSTCANITVGGGNPCDDFEACFVPSQTSPGVVFFNNCTSPGVSTQYVWSFGDGSMGSGVAPTHTYAVPGTYTVCLTAYWNTCVDSTCTTIVVQGGGDPCDDLQAGFTFTTTPNGVQFANTTTGTGANTTWLWIFDDGTTSTTPQPFHTFPVAGIYEVCLKVISTYTDDNGGVITCTDTYCAPVTWGGDPCAGFQACFVTNDFGDGEFFFDNCSSQQGNAQFIWNFGDGTTSSVVNVEHTYQQPGTYTVCLTAIWGNCVDSTCTTVIVEGGGDPCDDFNATISWSPSGNNTITFVGTTTLPAGSMLWYFGDGTQGGFGLTATHTYTAPGQYHACLVAWYWNDQTQDSCVTEACVWVTVGTTTPCDSLSANFWWQGGGPSGNISYWAIWESGVNWLWSFGDGTFSDNGHQGTHTYAQPGVYQLCLTVTALIPGTLDTCSTTSCQWVTIVDGDPCEGFDATISWSPSGNNTITFVGTTTVPGAAIMWHFGDGTEGFGQTVTHTYTAPGQYHVCLVSWYWNDQIQDSCFAEACAWITVGTTNPCDSLSANFWLQGGGTPGSIFYSAASGAGPNWLWSFGDGTFSDDGPQGIHTYAEPGLYHVCLTVFAFMPGTQDTCSVTSCQWITISGPDPCAGFDATMTWSAGDNNSATFAGTTTLPAASTAWYFGDGSSAFGPTATHTYAEPGQYYVCFEAWYWNQELQDSCATEDCQWITVGDGNPCDSLNAGFTSVVTGLGVNFQNAVLNNQWAYYWTFGDGTSGGGFNPFHAYTSAGTYHVCLLVWTWDPIAQDTCFADHCEWITVGGNPCDAFEACFEPDQITATGFQFINCTMPEVGVQFTWNFGDGTTSSEISPDHNYQQPGTYTVCLTAYWGNCIDSTCTVIVVQGGDPCDGFDAAISWSPSGNNSATFVGTTSPPAAGMIWYFGDGTQSFGQTVSHTYTAPGQYHVCLAAWYWNQQIQDSCWTETCVWITVGTGNPCDGLNPNFTATVTGQLANFQNIVVNAQWSYFWSFGDGTTGDGPNPAHVYSGPGTYNVCLTIWTWDPVEQDTCFADHCMWLTIGGDPCDALEACFEIDPISATAFQFVNCTTPEIGVQFVWHFGDGSTGTGASPDHAYQEPGVYTVCLTAYWQDCVDSTCTTLTVGSGTPCDNNFETDFTWTAQGTAVIFQGTSNLPANLLWFFGDGTMGNGPVVTHLYEPPGPYNVCLAAWYWNPQTQDTCWAEHCELIDPFDPTNDIVDADLAGVRIYPQPATDVITIDGMDAAALLRLFGSDGRLVLQERAQAAVHHLDVSDLATGVYVLHLDIDDRSARYRIAVE